MTNQSSIDTLIANLRDDDWQVRYDAANQLKTLQDQRAVPALIDALEDDNPTVCFIAAMTLGIIQNSQSVVPLVKLLRSTKDHDVLWAAAWALSELGALSSEPLIQILQTEDPFTRDVAADVLGGIGDARAIPHLLRALMEHAITDYPETGRFGAADALERFGELSLAAFVEALNHEEADIRARAAQALGNIGKPEAIPALVAHLDDTALVFESEQLRVCDAIVTALKAIGTDDAHKALQNWQQGDP